jgi:hypothetical protein
MTIPSASLTEILISGESALGTASGNVAVLRVTSESLVPAVSTIASEEIDSTRNVSDLNKVSSMGEGEIEFEFKDDAPTDILLQSLIGTTAGNVAVGLVDDTDYFNGTTQSSFSIEKKTTDGSTPLYQEYNGMVPSTLELTAESGSFVTGTVGFMGSTVNAMSGSASLTATDSATETTPFTTVDTNTTVLYDASADSVTYADYGALPGSAKVTAFSISIDNGLRAQTQIGSTDLAGIGAGRFTVTGSLTVYATNETLFNNYINTTKFGLMFQVGDSTNNYRFYLPEVKLTSAQVLAGGNDEDVLMELEWQAVKSTISGVNSDVPFTMKLVKNEA